jgi:hypothetical protein
VWGSGWELNALQTVRETCKGGVPVATDHLSSLADQTEARKLGTRNMRTLNTYRLYSALCCSSRQHPNQLSTVITVSATACYCMVCCNNMQRAPRGVSLILPAHACIVRGQQCWMKELSRPPTHIKICAAALSSFLVTIFAFD